MYIAATNSLQVGQDKKEKFSKMMGLKSSFPSNPPPQPDLLHYNQTQEDLQKQYDESRVQTHMMKGSDHRLWQQHIPSMIPPVLAVLVSFESGFVGTVLIMRSFSNTLLLANKCTLFTTRIVNFGFG